MSNHAPERIWLCANTWMGSPLDYLNYATVIDEDTGNESYIPYRRETVCEWTWNEYDAGGELDGAFFDTSCGERVEPAPGAQRCCHMCGGTIRIVEGGEHDKQ
jgi:hypothetical protein